MTMQIPKIDSRSAEDIADKVKQNADIAAAKNNALAEALVSIFARYCEIIIERLNKVPEKNYHAFLNELGVFRNPPLAAVAPLTFKPVKHSADLAIVVPQFTKVTAPASPGETTQVVFETDRILNLTLAKLYKIVMLDTISDRYNSYNIDSGGDTINSAVFTGVKPIEHVLYIGLNKPLLAGKLSTLHLLITTEFSLSQANDTQLEWKIENGSGGELIMPEIDTSNALRRSGELIFKDLPEWTASALGNHVQYWLSCRLISRLGISTEQPQANSYLKLPSIQGIKLSGISSITAAKVDYAFANHLPLDLSKDFFPFGKYPKFSDVLYLSCRSVWQLGNTVCINIKLTNPASAKHEPPITRVNQEGSAVIQWEFWNGAGWESLICNDTSQGFTEDGTVTFCIPSASQSTQINGIDSEWLRVRLISGNYGHEASFLVIGSDQGGLGFNYQAATLAPPAIESISLNSVNNISPTTPDVIMVLNDFELEIIDLAQNKYFTPFRRGRTPSQILYCGLKAANPKLLAGHYLDLFFRISHNSAHLAYRGQQQSIVLSWQYWNGKTWQVCKIIDETQSLNCTGLVSLLVPEDLATWHETSLAENEPIFWIRAVLLAGEYQSKPILQQVLINTVMATQMTTLSNEILGSGNGDSTQIFYSARTPILGELRLEIREQQIPSAAELASICESEGAEAVTYFHDAQGQIEGIWVRWHEVKDFLSSGNSDRHFIVDRLSGEIRFGDGINGMLPPLGANNIRLQSYKTGGGSSGNKPENSITKLQSSVPWVDSALNLVAAAGGEDQEEWRSVYARGSTMLRHRDRAVTVEDYEDLALTASREVARAKCFPLLDLASNSPYTKQAGVISLVVIPGNKQAMPKPGFDLLRRVWVFLDQKRDQNAGLIILGPDYLRINLEISLVPAGEADITSDCLQRVERFLHPITGGNNAQGWEFGQIPHESDFIALLAGVTGVESVKSVCMSMEEERTGLLNSNVFLVCSGQHKIYLSS
ncbi:MAG: putative baseplate assembly protein [Methylococcaceae bacterium]|nr:putative baseplate assembly protein [Methylococcaceae bacterium]